MQRPRSPVLSQWINVAVGNGMVPCVGFLKDLFPHILAAWGHSMRRMCISSKQGPEFMLDLFEVEPIYY